VTTPPAGELQAVTAYHLAQINIARFREPKDHPVNAGFMDALDHVNALAEASPGFVWRMVGETTSAVDVEVAEDDPRLAANLTVWTDIEALAAFAYRNLEHRAIMRRRKEWFEHIDTYMALWWIPAGQTPTLADAMRRLAVLAQHGPTQEAFLFAAPFPPPGEAAIAPVLEHCD
jgi:hypothetical protein